MTTNQYAAGIGFTRCAVCKIDLKGRFVYLDEKIESLLGYTKEELFGKSFLEFLDEPSQQQIEALLSQRNHYETFYDATTISLLDRSGQPLKMRVVVSLNFIAGNPVNYQLIIDHEGPAPESTLAPKTADYRSFLSELSRIGSLADWKELLRLLCRFVGTHQACLYLINEDSLELRSAVSTDAAGEFVFNHVPEPGMLHKLVAESGDEYSFIDQNAVQYMIEQCGSAPNEFVTRLETTRGNSFVMRLVFADDFAHDRALASIRDARLALDLFVKFLENDSADQDQTPSVRFTVGFLDALAIPAFLTGADGSIVGYNPSTLRLFSEAQLEGNYLEVLNHYVGLNPPGLIDSVVDYLNTSGEQASPDDMVVSLKVSHAERMKLSVMKLSDENRDLSGCFVFVPEASDTAAPPGCDSTAIWRSVLRQLRQYLKSTEGLTRQFGHEFYNQLGETGNADLERLAGGIRDVRAIVGEMSRFARLFDVKEPSRLIDLNLLVAEQMRQLVPIESAARVNCTYQNLPKITTREDQLGYVIGMVLRNSISYSDSDATNIRIKADVRDGICRITITDNGFGIAAKHLPRVFEPLYRAPEKKVKAIAGHGLGLTLAREITRALGGDINITSVVGEGSEVKINLPTE
ncbi:MAG: PAS domain-containing sensor histidine kinase [Candidatus Zixiibacteriota bacterium]|nr:MAG: PAS domain-containing sensor histidine kinase [candidate division Zixibacteria bacterium]